MSAERKELHQLIDKIPENELETAKRFLEFLAIYDPVIYNLYTTPYDDEPVSEKEDAETKEAWQEYLQGKSYSLSEAEKKIFGE